MNKKYHDVTADHKKHEYRVIERDSGKTVATFSYKTKSETSRGIAHGQANIRRRELNQQ